MKKLLITTLFLSSTLFLQSQTCEKNFIDQNYIEVTGKAQVEITPDIFIIKILISEKDIKTKIPINETEQKMISKLKDLGIDVGKDLSIKDLSSSFQTHILAKTDIAVSKEYTLSVHSTKTLASVFTELEAIGISNLRIIKVDSSNIEEFRKEVKVKAIKAAKEKAIMLTAAIGQTIGRAMFIQENDSWQTKARIENVAYMYVPATAAETEKDIDFEKITIDYSVLVRFELK